MLAKLTLNRFENNAAILKTEDNCTIIWPKSKLPGNIKPGSVLIFNILGDSVKGKNNKEIAKEILNEILNVKSDC